VDLFKHTNETKLVQSPAVLSTLFADYYAAGKRRGVNVLACGWQSALLANPRSDIQCTAL
jgi:hypothetical protein